LCASVGLIKKRALILLMHGANMKMVMNVLEEYSGSVYTGHQMIVAVGSSRIFCAAHLDCAVL
jgi:hypothetical protein